MPERFNMLLDAATKHDLAELDARLNLHNYSAVIRLALREACERRRIKPYSVHTNGVVDAAPSSR